MSDYGRSNFPDLREQDLRRRVAELEAKVHWMRDRFEDIVEDAKVLREHARRAPDLDMMILGIQTVAENETRSVDVARFNEESARIGSQVFVDPRCSVPTPSVGEAQPKREARFEERLACGKCLVIKSGARVRGYRIDETCDVHKLRFGDLAALPRCEMTDRDREIFAAAKAQRTSDALPRCTCSAHEDLHQPECPFLQATAPYGRCSKCSKALTLPPAFPGMVGPSYCGPCSGWVPRPNDAHRFVFESPNCVGCGEHTSRAIGSCPGSRPDKAKVWESDTDVRVGDEVELDNGPILGGTSIYFVTGLHLCGDGHVQTSLAKVDTSVASAPANYINRLTGKRWTNDERAKIVAYRKESEDFLREDARHRSETASHCEVDDWPPLRVTQATAKAREETRTDVLRAAISICREVSDEWQQMGLALSKRQIGKQAADECAVRIAEFLRTFEVVLTGGTGT